MGIFGRFVNATIDVQQQTSVIKNSRKQIFEIRDRLRGTPLFANLFYTVIGDANHPPMKIVCDHANSAFWSIAWDLATNNYEPYSTLKYTDVNIGYYEACAIYLLIQESYPNVYDFPNKTITQIQNNEPIELIMKKPFLNRKIVPNNVPEKPRQAQQPVNTASSAPVGAAKFCTVCGTKLRAEDTFCSGCGNKIN